MEGSRGGKGKKQIDNVLKVPREVETQGER